MVNQFLPLINFRLRMRFIHVGQYSFENDLLPKSFVHIGSLAELAHQRQKYILSHLDSNGNVEELAQEWAQTLLANLTT